LTGGARVDAVHPLGSVLMEMKPVGGEGWSPALVQLRTAGDGRVLVVLGEGWWRAGMGRGGPAGGGAAGAYASLWTGAVRWLARAEAAGAAGRASVTPREAWAKPGEATSLDLVLPEPAGAAPEVWLMPPAGAAVKAEVWPVDAAGLRWEARVKPAIEGVHGVELRRPGGAAPVKARLAAYDPSEEAADVSARPEVLRRLCEATGGRLLERDAGPAFLDVVRDAGRADAPAAGEGLRSDPARPTWLMWLALALGGEWWLRRRWGLR
jgi:hypothetical protein